MGKWYGRFFEASFLRRHSPSAEQAGEMDIFGRITGGNSSNADFSNVDLIRLNPVGNYGLRLTFSDGHDTGIYSWEYFNALKKQSQVKKG